MGCYSGIQWGKSSQRAPKSAKEAAVNQLIPHNIDNYDKDLKQQILDVANTKKKQIESIKAEKTPNQEELRKQEAKRQKTITDKAIADIRAVDIKAKDALDQIKSIFKDTVSKNLNNENQQELAKVLKAKADEIAEAIQEGYNMYIDDLDWHPFMDAVEESYGNMVNDIKEEIENELIEQGYEHENTDEATAEMV